MMRYSVEQRLVRAFQGDVAVYLQGNPAHAAVVMGHSILSSSAMWDEQAALLAEQGWYVVRIDTTGHGHSPAPSAAQITMNGLAADTVAVLDALGIEQAHYVGLSLGGMSGLGLGIHHAQRFSSLVLCDARADAPPAVAAPWDERIEAVHLHGSCQPLAAPTIERWFGSAFVVEQPHVAQRLQAIAASTTVAGFVGCARAIQGLNYLHQVGRMAMPVSLLVGANDGVLPAAMQDLQQRIPGAALETIASAGHLPNIDQAAAFNVALLRHFARWNPLQSA